MGERQVPLSAAPDTEQQMNSQMSPDIYGHVCKIAIFQKEVAALRTPEFARRASRIQDYHLFSRNNTQP